GMMHKDVIGDDQLVIRLGHPPAIVVIFVIAEAIDLVEQPYFFEDAAAYRDAEEGEVADFEGAAQPEADETTSGLVHLLDGAKGDFDSLLVADVVGQRTSEADPRIELHRADQVAHPAACHKGVI